MAVVVLDSLHGAFVHGRPVARALLEAGLVRVGDALLRIGRFSERWAGSGGGGWSCGSNCAELDFRGGMYAAAVDGEAETPGEAQAVEKGHHD